MCVTRSGDVTNRGASRSSADSCEHERALVVGRWRVPQLETGSRISGAVDIAVHRGVPHSWSVGAAHRSSTEHILRLENRFAWRHLPLPGAPDGQSWFYVRPKSSEFRRQTST